MLDNTWGNKEQEYDTGAIRRMVEDAFDDEGLVNLCFDKFPPVYEKFADGQKKSERVRMLVDHARRNNLLNELLKCVEEANPNKYEEYRDKLVKERKSSEVKSRAGKQSAGEASPITFRNLEKMRDAVERLDTYVDLSYETLNVLEESDKFFKETQKFLDKYKPDDSVDNEWRRKGYSAIGELVLSLNLVSPKVNAYVKKLTTSKERFRKEDYDSVPEQADALGRARDATEEPRERLCKYGKQLAKQGPSASLRENIRGEVVELADAIQQMMKPVSEIRSALYGGMKHYVEELAGHVK